jgi:hypothetical protein
MQQDADPSTQPEQSPDSTFTIKRIGIHVPPFCPKKPAMCFLQLQGQFALLNITQDATKFHYVTSKLDNKYAVEVEDVTQPTPHPQAIMTELKQKTLQLLSLVCRRKVTLSQSSNISH